MLSLKNKSCFAVLQVTDLEYFFCGNKINHHLASAAYTIYHKACGGVKFMTYQWPEDIVSAVGTGEISPLEAFRKLRELDNHATACTHSNNLQFGIEQRIENVLRELDSLIGLNEVKKLAREIYAFIEIQKRREREHLNTEPMVLHMIFKGNPGTGKTTVARIMGKVFREMGVLSRGHLIEVERADLVGEYIGHTAQKTREQLKKAYGGILFIDEAYSLARGGEKDFGKEAIDCMVMLRK